jgi:hypothetical protein
VGVIPEVLLVADEDDGDVGAEVTDLGGPNLGDVLFKKTHTKITHTFIFNFQKYKHRVKRFNLLITYREHYI